MVAAGVLDGLYECFKGSPGERITKIVLLLLLGIPGVIGIGGALLSHLVR